MARYLIRKPIRSYTGFDRHPGMIDWCNLEIAPRDSRFRFDYFDLESVYVDFDEHPGRIDAGTFAFPYPTAAFDAAFLASVFTYMPLDEIAHYLSELRRVMRPTGRVVLSVFFSEHGSRTESITFFYVPSDFVATASAAGFEVRHREQRLYFGYDHNWYVLAPC